MKLQLAKANKTIGITWSDFFQDRLETLPGFKYFRLN